jgi:hypothetical protein
MLKNRGSIRNFNQFGISSWVTDTIAQEINTTIRQFLQETVATFLEKQKNDMILDLLLNEILLEMDFANESKAEFVIIDYVQEMIDMEIFILVQNLLFDMSLESKLLVYTKPRVKAKSKKVDLVMDNLLDSMIFDQILEYKVNDQISEIENKMDTVLDAIFVKCILHQLSK